MTTTNIIQLVFDIAVLALIWYAGYYDKKTRLVEPWVQWTFLCIGLAHTVFLFIVSDSLYMPLNCIFTGAGVFAFYLLLVFIFEQGIGGGDTKMTSLMGLFLGWEQGFTVVIIHCLVALAYVGIMKLVKKKHIASVPAMVYMAIGYTVVKAVYWTTAIL